MNIQEAKQEIKRSLRAYAKRDESGALRIPPEKQRPLLLIGPPGIGKTAIMKQISQETGCGLVAYSMTHHTRQSAIGLPFISQKEYGGKSWSVTEYTMSEIVASIYEYMERTGKKEGILFLDEINCVSETLAPVMLQLLQNKTFGNTPLPEGWVIVAAGNPPEYNRSVRELDMVTLDRVKNMEIEADLSVWMDYAREHGVHPAIRSYLCTYPDHFYSIKDTDRGQLFVTARGWEDLSLMLLSYEEDGTEVGPDWFLQYLQHDDIARSFGLYYGLYRHFSENTDEDRLPEMLLSKPEELKSLSLSECLSLASMLYSPIKAEAESIDRSKALTLRKGVFAANLTDDDDLKYEEWALRFFSSLRKSIEERAETGVLKLPDEIRDKKALEALEDDIARWRKLEKDERPPFRKYEQGIKEQELKALASREDGLAAAVEKAFFILSQSPEGGPASIYLAGDIAASDACRGILSEHRSPAFEKEKAKLEQEQAES
ncbi:MAG: AAA family ATPase [Firmicutes bacterium]|nr:AAA family ATPase [Bacillota bacterium]